MNTEFNFKNWAKTMGVTLVTMIIMGSIPRFPEFLLGWLTYMVYMYMYSVFTKTKLKYVPKNKITEDMH